MMTPKASLLGAVLLSLSVGTTAWARSPQSTPASLPDRIVTSNESLSGDDQKLLAKFIEGYTNLIESATATGAAEDARRALVEPFRGGLAKAGFRNAYSNAAVPHLKTIIEGKDTRRAILAMQVAAFIATKDSLALIAARLGEGEPDVAKRQNAASTIGHAFERVAGTNARIDEPGPRLNDIDIDTLTRTIAAAAAKESEISIVLQELRALSIIAARPGVGAKSASLARENHTDVVEAVLQRVEASPTPDGRIRIVTSAIADFQRQWTRDTSSHAAVGPIIAPLLMKVLRTSGNRWDAVHGSASDGIGDDYGQAVASAEVLLRVIDARLRSNAAPVTAEKEIATAWKDGDRKAFDAAVEKWAKVVAGAPYKK
jgi:hypothetical protein